MPVLNVSYSNKKSANRKRDFINECVNIIVEEASCGEGAIKVFLNEYEEENVRNKKPVIFLDWMDVPEKRTQAVKEKIAERITDEIVKLTGEPKEGVIVLINDYPSRNVCIGGKCKS